MVLSGSRSGTATLGILHGVLFLKCCGADFCSSCSLVVSSPLKWHHQWTVLSPPHQSRSRLGHLMKHWEEIQDELKFELLSHSVLLVWSSLPQNVVMPLTWIASEGSLSVQFMEELRLISACWSHDLGVSPGSERVSLWIPVAEELWWGGGYLPFSPAYALFIGH